MERIRTHLRRGESRKLPAQEAMTGLLSLLGFSADLYAVFEIWDREIQGVVRGCEATGLWGSRLCVKVPSTSHRQEILYMKDRLIARVNQAMGRRAITDIQFELSNDRGGPIRDEVKTRFGSPLGYQRAR